MRKIKFMISKLKYHYAEKRIELVCLIIILVKTQFQKDTEFHSQFVCFKKNKAKCSHSP